MNLWNLPPEKMKRGDNLKTCKDPCGLVMCKICTTEKSKEELLPRAAKPSNIQVSQSKNKYNQALQTTRRCGTSNWWLKLNLAYKFDFLKKAIVRQFKTLGKNSKVRRNEYKLQARVWLYMSQMAKKRSSKLKIRQTIMEDLRLTKNDWYFFWRMAFWTCNLLGFGLALIRVCIPNVIKIYQEMAVLLPFLSFNLGLFIK